MIEFPRTLDFYYDGSMDEWVKICGDGKLILFRKILSYEWSLSYVNSDDDQLFISENTDEVELEQIIKEYQRDSKINLLLDLTDDDIFGI